MEVEHRVYPRPKVRIEAWRRRKYFEQHVSGGSWGEPRVWLARVTDWEMGVVCQDNREEINDGHSVSGYNRLQERANRFVGHKFDQMRPASEGGKVSHPRASFVAAAQ